MAAANRKVTRRRLNNPVAGGNDSTPYAVAALPSCQVVADAGGNTLTEVAANGTMRTLAVFPSRLVAATPMPDVPPGAMIPTIKPRTGAANKKAIVPPGEDGFFASYGRTGPVQRRRQGRLCNSHPACFRGGRR